jgi:isoquinoline 1-oxidoreductase subunit beta
MGALAVPSLLTRRAFLKNGAASGGSLVLGFYLAAPARCELPNRSSSGHFAPNAWLELAATGEVNIWCAKSEMGQGVRTALPMIVAEELCCDWQRVQVVQADLDAKYGEQLTGGSLSVRTSYATLRKAGAAAREVLLAAAAEGWSVPRSECHAENGAVVHATTKRVMPFGQLIGIAVTIAPPTNPPLKKTTEFQLVGTPTPRTDTPVKVTGQAEFGIDVRVPGMLVASVERCLVFGGTVKRFDAENARKMPGVRAVVELKATHLTHQFGDVSGPGSRNFTCAGIAVVADSTWAALEARKALEIEWLEGPAAQESTMGLREQFAKLVSEPAAVMRSDGDFDQAFGEAAKKIEAVYEVPFLAHATMEPMNCTAYFYEGGCELWAPTQVPGAAAASVAQALGISRERVRVHVTFLGGGFGRRLIQDYAVEAALISREVQAPVQVIWSREDDIRHDFYRPASCHFFRAGIDVRGNLAAWLHRGASPSIDVFYSGTGLSAHQASQLDEGDFPAGGVPNYRVEFALAQSGMPLGYWRSVENSGNQFAISSFFDEAAAAAGRDPVEFLLAVLGPERKTDTGHGGVNDVGRRRRVIELAAEKSGWNQPLSKGRGRGIAAHFGYGSYVAQVAEVSWDSTTRRLKIDRVVCAIDCGLAINPSGVKAQMEGAIHFGLAAALKSAITVDRGRVEQSNFNDYEVLRMADAPLKIDVYIVPSSEAPGGCGEPGVPPIAPAVGNAIYAATGQRVRRLPIREAEIAKR